MIMKRKRISFPDSEEKDVVSGTEDDINRSYSIK